MIIKQIAIDEALELHKRGLMVGVLQPVVPEPKNLDDYEFLTLKKILEGCEFFRIVLEEEKRETEPAEKEQAEVAKPKAVEEKPAETGTETYEIAMNAVGCDVPHRYIRECMTGVKEPQKQGIQIELENPANKSMMSAKKGQVNG